MSKSNRENILQTKFQNEEKKRKGEFSFHQEIIHSKELNDLWRKRREGLRTNYIDWFWSFAKLFIISFQNWNPSIKEKIQNWQNIKSIYFNEKDIELAIELNIAHPPSVIMEAINWILILNENLQKLIEIKQKQYFEIESHYLKISQYPNLEKDEKNLENLNLQKFKSFYFDIRDAITVEFAAILSRSRVNRQLLWNFDFQNLIFECIKLTRELFGMLSSIQSIYFQISNSNPIIMNDINLFLFIFNEIFILIMNFVHPKNQRIEGLLIEQTKKHFLWIQETKLPLALVDIFGMISKFNQNALISPKQFEIELNCISLFDWMLDFDLMDVDSADTLLENFLILLTPKKPLTLQSSENLEILENLSSYLDNESILFQSESIPNIYSDSPFGYDFTINVDDIDVDNLMKSENERQKEKNFKFKIKHKNAVMLEFQTKMRLIQVLQKMIMKFPKMETKIIQNVIISKICDLILWISVRFANKINLEYLKINYNSFVSSCQMIAQSDKEQQLKKVLSSSNLKVESKKKTGISSKANIFFEKDLQENIRVLLKIDINAVFPEFKQEKLINISEKYFELNLEGGLFLPQKILAKAIFYTPTEELMENSFIPDLAKNSHFNHLFLVLKSLYHWRSELEKEKKKKKRERKPRD
eukprot:Anaeramoba_ignava/a610111_29.p1 GENE.a610111_29~~a610111_29.p1  ORF type:complete len:645 (-),score=216.44 a610111_29:71-2005(-)